MIRDAEWFEKNVLIHKGLVIKLVSRTVSPTWPMFDDIINDVFTLAWMYRNNYDASKGAMTTWLGYQVRNAMGGRRRSWRHEVDFEKEVRFSDTDHAEMVSEAAESDDDTEAMSLDRTAAAEWMDIVHGLEDRKRRMMLRIIGGDSRRAAVEDEGITIEVGKKLIRDAREEIRREAAARGLAEYEALR